ncbi:hypothetical protein F1559_002450 [Cyanidiococcus yangmingshanensis]|uniref:Uncharacterized protein n=1 Tax=Cyanidiococcus yangmingshanensis TaxID=2690220 RepID=A0A7J7IHF6_9RHOD|nr:hypothetical protein F1559_002450 [Cyanidiococcus yangmingshanensis]
MDLWVALDACDNELPYGCLTFELARVTATLDVVPNDGSVWGAASLSQFITGTGHLAKLQGLTKADSVDDRLELLVERIDETLIQELVRVAERVSEALDTGWTPHPFALPETESGSPPSTYYQTPTSTIDVLAPLQKRLGSSSPALFRAARLSLERAVVTPPQVSDAATTTSMETIGKLPPTDVVLSPWVARDLPSGFSAEKWKQKQLYRESGVLLMSAVKAMEASWQHESAISVATVSRFCAAMRMLGRLPEATLGDPPELESILRRGLTCCLDLLRETSVNTWDQRAIIAEWVFSLSQTPADLFENALQEEHLELSVQTLRQGLDRAANLLDQSAWAIDHAGFESIPQTDSTLDGERETGWRLWKRCALLLAKLADLMGSHLGVGESQHLQSVFVALAAVNVANSIADRVGAAGTESGCSCDQKGNEAILRQRLPKCCSKVLDAWMHSDGMTIQATGSATWSSNCTGRYPPVGLLSTLLDVIGRTSVASFMENSIGSACASNESTRDWLEPTSRPISAPVFMQSATSELLQASGPFIETALELLFAYLPHHRDALGSVSRNRLALLLRYLEHSLRHAVSSEPVSLILLQLLIRHTLAWSASLGHQHTNENLHAVERCLRIADLIQSLLKMEGVYDPSTSIDENSEHLRDTLVARNPLWLLLAGPLETHHAVDDRLTEPQLPTRPLRRSTSPVQTGHQASQLPSPAAVIRCFRSFLERSLGLLRERALALLYAALGSPRATFRARAVRLFGEMSRMDIKEGWQVSQRGVDRAEQPNLQETHSSMPRSRSAAPEARATRESLGQTVDPAECADESLIDKAIALATACCLDMSPRVRESALAPYVSWMHWSGKPITAYTIVYSRLCDVSVTVRQRAIQILDSLLWEKEPLSMTDWAFATAHLFLRLNDPLPAIRQLAQRVLYAHIFRRQIDFDFLVEDALSPQTEIDVAPGQPLRRSRHRVRYLDEQREWQVSPLKRPEGPSSSSTGPFQRMLLVCERLDREFATDGALGTSTLVRRFLLIDEGVVALTRTEATNMASVLMNRQAYSPLMPLIQLDAQLAVPFLPALVNRLHSFATEPNLSSGIERELFWIVRILESCSRVVGQANGPSRASYSVYHSRTSFWQAKPCVCLRALHDRNEHVSSWMLRNAAYWQRIDSLWGLLERLWADADSQSSSLLLVFVIWRSLTVVVHPDAVIKAVCCIFWASSTDSETKASAPRLPLEQAHHSSVIARQALQHLVMHEGPSVASGFRDALLSAWRFCRNRHAPPAALSTGRGGDAAIAAETTCLTAGVESPHPDEIDRFLRLNLRYNINEHICGFVLAGLRAPALRRRVLQDLVSVLTSSPLDERYPIDERCSIALFLATLPRSDESSSPETAFRAEIRSVLEALDRNLDATEGLVDVALSESSIQRS